MIKHETHYTISTRHTRPGAADLDHPNNHCERTITIGTSGVYARTSGNFEPETLRAPSLLTLPFRCYEDMFDGLDRARAEAAPHVAFEKVQSGACWGGAAMCSTFWGLGGFASYSHAKLLASALSGTVVGTIVGGCGYATEMQKFDHAKGFVNLMYQMHVTLLGGEKWSFLTDQERLTRYTKTYGEPYILACQELREAGIDVVFPKTTTP